MPAGIVVRGLRKVRTLLAEGPGLRGLDGKQLVRIRELLHECASDVGGEISARQCAGRLSEAYLLLDDEGRATFLRIIATNSAPIRNWSPSLLRHHRASTTSRTSLDCGPQTPSAAACWSPSMGCKIHTTWAR